MCIGIPMQVIESGEGHALCRAGTEVRRIDTMLVGETREGDWLLTFLDTAREIISAESARQINDALTALNLAIDGNSRFDHLFADLVDREPQLPDFARAASSKPNQGD